MYRTHGMSHLPEYRVWHMMKQRCRNPNTIRFENYGGRGITACKRWDKFVNFYADMGPRPSSKHTLDRIDNDGPYKKSNCRWAIRKVQQRNRRGNRMVKYCGESVTLMEWSERLGINVRTLYSRFNRGWNAKTAFTLAPDIANSVTRSARFKKRDNIDRLA